MKMHEEKRPVSGQAQTQQAFDGKLIHRESFASEFIAARPVDVWLPADYDAESDKRYPVIYMHDGQFLFDHPTSPYAGTAWIWGVDKTMTRLVNEHKIRAAIIVSVWSQPKRLRTAEYMPQKPVTDVDNQDNHVRESELPDEPIGSDNYLKFLVEELKPLVDATYRTRPDRDNTHIMGSSMGGMISAYAIAEYPEVFGGAACMSTHWTRNGAAVLDWYRNHWPTAGSNRVYFDYGTETLDAEYEVFQLQMDAIMVEHGFQDGANWVTRKFDGANHSPRAWRERLHIPLEFLLGPN